MGDSRKVSRGEARIRDGMRVYAIGDIHGCIDELDALLQLIDGDLQTSPVDEHRLIFIGDYVDRGPDSKGIIDRLIGLQQSREPVTCLLGNHEEKLISAFTDMDERMLPGFTRYGGLETLTSYGCVDASIQRVLDGKLDTASLQKFRNQVKSGIGQAHAGFLSTLHVSTQQDDYFFCHAGVDPEVDLDGQSRRDLAWMREPFLTWHRPLEKVVVHGHTPTRKPELLRHRINVDTGCVYGGMLSCVVLEENHQRFLTVPAFRNYHHKQGF